MQNPAERPTVAELGAMPWIAGVRSGAGHEYRTQPLLMESNHGSRHAKTGSTSTEGTWQNLFMRFEPDRLDVLLEPGESSAPGVATKLSV